MARQDHIGVIAGVAFLALEPVAGPTGGWKDYWDRFKLRWRLFAWYWGGGILAILALCFRHWLLGGDFIYVVSPPNPPVSSWQNMYYLLTAYHWPNFPLTISAFVVTLGTFLALTALLWRPKPLSNFPLSLGIMLLGLMAPYYFVTINYYPPRFSMHLLPIAILSLMIFLNNLNSNSKCNFDGRLRGKLKVELLTGLKKSPGSACYDGASVDRQRIDVPLFF